MSSKKLNFDLYRINNSENPEVTLWDFLSNKKKRYVQTRRSSGIITVLKPFQVKPDLILGTIYKGQFNDLPDALDMATMTAEKLNFTESQALTYSSSFLYDKRLNLLMFQSAKNGPSINDFCNFIEHNFGVNGLEIEFAIDPKDMVKIQKMDIIKSFTFRAIKVQDGGIFYHKNTSVGDMLTVADETDSSSMDVHLSAGHGKRSLNVNKIIRMVKDLMRFKGNDELVKLQVTGKEDSDDHTEKIDLIANRIRYSFYIERTRFQSEFSTADKYEKMVDLYMSHFTELRAYYSKRN